jgi:hypothetical protein
MKRKLVVGSANAMRNYCLDNPEVFPVTTKFVALGRSGTEFIFLPDADKRDDFNAIAATASNFGNKILLAPT